MSTNVEGKSPGQMVCTSFGTSHPPLTIVDGIATIDVSDIDTSLLGHGYFQRADAVLNDLHALLTGEPEPADRPRLREQRTEDGRSYWEFRA
jgi:hypothetical protein